MFINFGVSNDSSPKAETIKPNETKNPATIDKQGKFENLLTDATGEQASQQKASSEPVISEKAVPSNVQAHSQYGFAKGPGYGSGLGTAGYGSDATAEPENSLKPADTAVKKYSFAQGPGFGSGHGTAGYGSDSSTEPESTLKSDK